MAIQKITPDEESRLPIFGSHEEASQFFTSQYGDAFVSKQNTELGGVTIYKYILIVDQEAYKTGQEKLARFEMMNGPEFMNSFQSIQITEDGEVEIGL